MKYYRTHSNEETKHTSETRCLLPAYKAAEEAVAVAFGKRPLAVRRGGSIPIISTFEQVLGIKTVLMGFGLEQNAIHSPNESCTLDFFYKGIESVAEFYKRFN